MNDDRTWRGAREILAPVVPQTFGEAFAMYPWIECEPHEWDNRTTVENAAWLISHYLARAPAAKTIEGE